LFIQFGYKKQHTVIICHKGLDIQKTARMELRVMKWVEGRERKGSGGEGRERERERVSFWAQPDWQIAVSQATNNV
jgi:hypothetical protein